MSSDIPNIFFRKVKFWSGDAPPVFNVDGNSYIFIKKNGLYFVAVTRQNLSPSMGIELLLRITKLVKDFLGVLNEDAIRKNFVLVYELLDEVLDFGYPQITATEVLKNCVQNEAVPVDPPVQSIPDAIATKGLAGLSTAVQNLSIGGYSVGQLAANLSSAPRTVASTATARPVGVGVGAQSGKNEIFADLIERLTVVMSSSGAVLHSAVDGSIQLKSYLAGNPQIRLGLNDDLVIAGQGRNVYSAGQVELEDCNFHEAVDLREFDDGRCLILNAPEGEFTAMNYRLKQQAGQDAIRPPIKVYPSVVLLSPTRVEVIIRVRADISPSHNVTNLELTLVLPSSTTSASVDCLPTTLGASGEFVPSKHSVVLQCRRLQGGQELSACVKFSTSQEFTSTAQAKKECGPILMGFAIPMFTASQLNIRYLRISQPYGVTAKEPPHKWIRYVTESNAYECRMH